MEHSSAQLKVAGMHKQVCAVVCARVKWSERRVRSIQKYQVYISLSRALRKGGLMSAQANQGQHFPLLLYFLFEGRLFLKKKQFRRKVSSLISKCGLHMLIYGTTIYARAINPLFTERGSYLIVLWIKVALLCQTAWTWLSLRRGLL